MTYRFFYLLLLVPALIKAQQPYAVNWAAAPKNPVPISYTTNHYGYTGKIKTITESWGAMSIAKTFDANGLQLNSSNKLDVSETTTYEYRPEKKEFTKQQQTADRKIVFVQTVNEKGQVITSGHTASELYLFVYNDKGLVTEKQYPAGKQVTKYTYNDAGQLVTEEMYRDSLLAIRYTYQYKTLNSLLEVNCTTLYKASGSQYSHKEVYDKAGMLVKEITDDEERTHSYQLDAAGNWTAKKTAFKSRTSKSVITREWNRTIEYWK